MTTGREEAGVALIMAILVVALVASVAAYLALSQQIWLRQAQNSWDMAQAQQVTRGAIGLSEFILDQAKQYTDDDLKQDWAQPLPVMPIAGGSVTARITDAQARFNLNNLQQPTGADLATFQRLLQMLHLDPALVSTLTDWIETGGARTTQGASDVDYLALNPPYRTAEQPLATVDELRWVKGYTADVVRKLKPFVVALPTRTTINLNTAPPMVLSALCGMSLNAAQQWVGERTQAPFTPMNLPPCAAPQSAYGVTSAYFDVWVKTRFGRMHQTVKALLGRTQTGVMTLLARERVLPDIVLPKGTSS